MSKWSSYPKAQLMTENWRRFLVQEEAAENIEEGILDKATGYIAQRSVGKVLAHRIKSNGGGAEGAAGAAADFGGLLSGEYEESSSPLLRTLHKAFQNDPQQYRATIAKATIDDVGEDLELPPSHRARRDSSEAHQKASEVYSRLDGDGKAILMKMWDQTDAARTYKRKVGDEAYAQEQAARKKGAASDRRRRDSELDAFSQSEKEKSRKAQQTKEDDLRHSGGPSNRRVSRTTY